MPSALRTGGRIASLLAATAVTAAGTILGTPVTGLGGMKFVSATAVVVYGSGGTAIKVYIQTSLDGGVTWIDIMSLTFTTASAKSGSSVQGASANAAAYTDGSLADNTTYGGVLGDRLRAKVITTGTYAGGTTVAVSACAKG